MPHTCHWNWGLCTGGCRELFLKKQSEACVETAKAQPSPRTEPWALVQGPGTKPIPFTLTVC